MPSKKMKLAITLEIEIEIDSRVTSASLLYAAEQAFEWCDGRMNLSTEMLEKSMQEVAFTIAASAQQAQGYEIARKYPGLQSRSYAIADRLPPVKTGYRIENVVSFENHVSVRASG